MTVGILGLGLIGGSLARAYALAGHTVYAAEKDESMLSFAQLAGAVDAPLTPENLPQCELVLLAIYPEGSAAWLAENAKYIDKSTLVMDCCGVKQRICEKCFPLAEQFGFTFIGGHPMAGKEVAGFDNAEAALYKGASMILVPTRSTAEGEIEQLTALGDQLVCNVLDAGIMEVEGLAVDVCLQGQLGDGDVLQGLLGKKL